MGNKCIGKRQRAATPAAQQQQQWLAVSNHPEILLMSDNPLLNPLLSPQDVRKLVSKENIVFQGEFIREGEFCVPTVAVPPVKEVPTPQPVVNEAPTPQAVVKEASTLQSVVATLVKETPAPRSVVKEAPKPQPVVNEVLAPRPVAAKPAPASYLENKAPNPSTPPAPIPARREYTRMPQDLIGWFDRYKKNLRIKKIPHKQRHPSYVGHALLCYLLTQKLGMTLTDHEPHEWIGNRRYNPDLELAWGSNCIVYCEVKCVDSSNQQQNYEAVKEQCYAGQQKNRRWNNILFVGFVVKGKELGFSICLGHCAKKFEQSIQGKCKTAEQLRLGI